MSKQKLMIIEVYIHPSDDGLTLEPSVIPNEYPHEMERDDEQFFTDTMSGALVLRICVNINSPVWKSKVVGRITHYLAWNKDSLYKDLSELGKGNH